MRHLDEAALQAWLDRDRSGLSPLERDEIALHLAGCTACRERLEEAGALSARTSDLLRPPETEEEPIPPYAEVVARARRRRTVGRRRSVWMTGGWAASLVVALGVGWMANELLKGGGVPLAPVQETTPAPTPAVEVPASESGTPEVIARPAPPPPSPQGAPTAREQPSPEAAETAPEAPERSTVGAHEGARVNTLGRTVVSGRVTDQDGRPLPAAQVYVEGTRSGTLTNPDGRFMLFLDGPRADSAPGDVTLTAVSIGYGTERRSVALGDHEVVADFQLAQEALALDEIVVTGTGPAGVTSGPPEIVLAPGGDERAWAEATRADAEERAGFDLLTVPELRVLRIQVEETSGVTLVRVVQELEDGGVLDLVEARGVLRFDAGAADDGRARASIRRGGVTIAAAAPVDARALEALLARVR